MSFLSKRDEALFNLQAKISTYGWTSYYIFGGPGPPWLYTIGLVEMVGHPELVVSGLDQVSAYGLVTGTIEEITSGREFAAGRDAGENLDATPVAFLEVDDRFWRRPHDYFLGWLDYYGAVGRKPARLAHQIVWSDEDGRFPWDDDFSEHLAHLQPLLDGPSPRAG